VSNLPIHQNIPISPNTFELLNVDGDGDNKGEVIDGFKRANADTLKKRKILKVLPRNLVLSQQKKLRGPRNPPSALKKGGPYSLKTNLSGNFSKTNTLLWPLPPDVAVHICSFLAYSEIPKLAMVCRAWQKAVYSRPYSHLWRTVIIGGDPMHTGYGQHVQLRFILRVGIMDYIETLLITRGTIGDFFPDEDFERYLAVFNLPRLRALILYATPVDDFKPILKQHSNLYYFFTEDQINLGFTLAQLPHLRCLSSSIIDVEQLRKVKTIYKQMEFVSFIFGVNSKNVSLIFCTFPHLDRVAIELEELVLDLPTWGQHSKLRTLHLSWKPGKFMRMPGRKGVVADRRAVTRWLKDLDYLDWLIIDRDYAFDDGTSLVEEARRVLRTVRVTTCPHSAGWNLHTFWKYIGET